MKYNKHILSSLKCCALTERRLCVNIYIYIYISASCTRGLTDMAIDIYENISAHHAGGAELTGGNAEASDELKQFEIILRTRNPIKLCARAATCVCPPAPHPDFTKLGPARSTEHDCVLATALFFFRPVCVFACTWHCWHPPEPLRPLSWSHFIATDSYHCVFSCWECFTTLC